VLRWFTANFITFPKTILERRPPYRFKGYSEQMESVRPQYDRWHTIVPHGTIYFSGHQDAQK
jgi:hypothetical protein